MYHIHCLNKISKIGLSVLKPTYQLSDDIHQADAVLVRSANMHDMILSSEVKAVARAGAGVNNIPLDVYQKQGVVVFNTPGANANAVKELTLLGMLMASRDVFGGMKWIESNREDTEINKTVEKVKSQFGGTEIFGKTIGIIGLGAIGILLAQACASLGMKVIGNKRNMNNIDEIKDQLPKDMVFVHTKEEIFQSCDFISLNMPLSKETKHMINDESFKQMKDGAILLNFARDALVDDDALQKALETGKIRAYVTDFPNHQTANMKGVIAIPHLGASTEEAEDNCAMMAANQLMDMFETGTLKNAVNFSDIKAPVATSEHRVTIIFDQENESIDHIKYALKHLQVTHLSHTNDPICYAIIDLKSINQIDEVLAKLNIIKYHILY